MIQNVLQFFGLRKTYWSENADHLKDYHRKYRLKVKREVLAYYSTTGKCECNNPNCTEHRIAKLELDHKHYGGNDHRRKEFGQNKGGYDLYCRLRKQGLPDKKNYIVLCKECNLKKGGKK